MKTGPLFGSQIPYCALTVGGRSPGTHGRGTTLAAGGQGRGRPRTKMGGWKHLWKDRAGSWIDPFQLATESHKAEDVHNTRSAHRVRRWPVKDSAVSSVPSPRQDLPRPSSSPITASFPQNPSHDPRRNKSPMNPHQAPRHRPPNIGGRGTGVAIATS